MNIFREHFFDANNRDTVEINIFHDLLLDILTYMYSGTLSINWPDYTDLAYNTELFQVINWYELYQLYKVFVKNDLQQVRLTRNPVHIESRLLPLDIVKGLPINNASYTCHVNPNPEYKLNFQIRVRKGN
ncbi:hypothetical protein AVEN_143112-1 [Araneus ventricosus]|uniref:BTB domain-containing protein n=1 Tax=Araneus ventricosus TaxID=182803 RepID=A0A4Y2KG88_ARAVE|nr:hypothetical protein AVEN_143112-1 [Araneus ventricosus]